jgi:hypothetical protein
MSEQKHINVTPDDVVEECHEIVAAFIEKANKYPGVFEMELRDGKYAMCLDLDLLELQLAKANEG